MASPLDEWIKNDDEVTSLLAKEWERQTTTVQLIASENFASPSVLAATGSILTNKYAEGYPGRRYYGGNYVVDEVEELARQRLSALFGADHANVQPHSGANANVAVYEALLNAGDTILAMRLDQGGHLTHGSPASITSKFWKFVSYGVTPRSDDPMAPGELIDFDNVRDLALEHRPKLIVAGATAYARIIDPEPFRVIADEVGALLMFDVAHVAGLIVGHVHPNPVPFADVVTFTTHKTLRGPRGGAIVCREEHAKKIDSAVFPGQQGGPLEHVIAAKAVSFKEASQPSFGPTPNRSWRTRKPSARRSPKKAFAWCQAAPRTTWCSSTCVTSMASSRAKLLKKCSIARASRPTATRFPMTRAAVHHVGLASGNGRGDDRRHARGRVRSDRRADGPHASSSRG